MVREAIGKKIRFEVFKRDSFKCQYCGQSAPDVLLHIDHIHPVKEGGDNSITNLVTACQGCNLGKGARTLSDSSAVSKQKEQMDDLNEKRLQLEMLMQWRKGLQDIGIHQVEIFKEEFCDRTGFTIKEDALKKVASLVRKYPFNLVLESLDAALNQYLVEKDDESGYTISSASKAFDMVPRICAVKTRNLTNPENNELLYIRGILKNRFYNWSNHDGAQAMSLMKVALEEGVSIDRIRYIATQTRTWNKFKEQLTELF